MTDIATAVGSRRPSLAAVAPSLVWILILVTGAAVQATGKRGLTVEMAGSLAAITVGQLLIAMACFPALAARPISRRLVLFAASAMLLALPLVISADAGAIRFVTACASTILVLKLWDLDAHVRAGAPLDPVRCFLFLINVFAISLRKMDDERVWSRDETRRKLAASGAATVAGAAAIGALYAVQWRRVPFLAEHTVKALVIFAAVLAALSLALAIVRASGGIIREYSDRPLLARTPADFWRRYNRVLGQYFYENVFKPLGGRRRPVTVTLFIFLMSGVMHEYVFGMAIGRAHGYQMAFFILQGIAVAATLRVRPRRGMAIAAGVAATLLFNAVSSIFFFLSFHAVVPLYVNQVPEWLRW